MKSFSNTYIFVFSIVMVTVVAALLSFVALQLKPAQENNIKVEKMQNILASVQVESTKKNADELFNKFITSSFVLNVDGDTLQDQDAFNVDLITQVSLIEKINQSKELLTERKVSPFKEFLSKFISTRELDKNTVMNTIKTEEAERLLPVYVCTKEDGNKYYVMPLRGKGLWGPIWGYISFESDMNTIYGAVFDHKGETPGLGAEINRGWFQVNFRGKKIFENGEFRSVEVAKPGTYETSDYTVDAISGGTITSKGVQAMIYDCLESYHSFFKQ